MDLQAVQDKIEIKELLYRYARACDRKDWKLLPTVFTPDAYLDYTSAMAVAASPVTPRRRRSVRARSACRTATEPAMIAATTRSPLITRRRRRRRLVFASLAVRASSARRSD